MPDSVWNVRERKNSRLAPLNKFIGPYGPFSLVVLLGVILDQATKWAAFKYLTDSHGLEKLVKLTFFFNLSPSRNEGGVFGVFQEGNLLFIVLSVLAVLVVLWIYIKSEGVDLVTTIALGNIIAGAVGNLIDRVYYHYVRDFMDLHIGTRHWPTFNLADVLICLGVGLMVLNILAPRTLRPRLPLD
ncbi:MAG: signal peptidase II [Candidatus Brocadiales bacterium]